MSFPARQSLIVLLAGIATGVTSAIIWPGDLNNEPLTTGHWVAVGGFLLTGVLLLIAAVFMVVAVTASAWKVDNFNVNEYLDDTTRDR